MSQIFILFDLDKNIDVATQEVRDKVNLAQAELPRDVDPPVVMKLDPGATPVMYLAVRSEKPLREVTELADKQVRRRLENDLMCTCGCRAPMGSCPMRPNCGHYDQQAAKLVTLLDQYKDDRDAVVAAFVQEYGSQAILTAPIDRGFNRLAWAVPYVVGLVMLAGIIFTARRWSRNSTPAVAGDAPIDATLSDRLDDELRNLD